jgi:nucleoside-diphosphate-sugar epimerase
LATNVAHTERFAARAAELPVLQRFLHVSTALVCGSATDRIVRETDAPHGARQLTLYTESKAELERRLPALFGTKLVIARPSVIVGHSVLGCAASSSIFWLFRMIHAARRIPFPPAHRIDIVPVDYCARALLHLLFEDALEHDCYHVSAGERGSCSFEEIDRALVAANGRVTAAQPLELFDIGRVDDLEPHFASWFGACDVTFTARAIRVYTAFARLNVLFDNTRLLAAGVPAPPRFCDYAGTCLHTSRSRTIAEQMTEDVRSASEPSEHAGQEAV